MARTLLERTDRRRAKRISLRLTCRLVPCPEGVPDAGVTRDVSRQGILVRWDPRLSLPEVNERIAVEVELPELEGFPRRCIRCQATVVRIDPGGEASGALVGLRVIGMDLRQARLPQGQAGASATTVRSWNSCRPRSEGLRISIRRWDGTRPTSGRNLR